MAIRTDTVAGDDFIRCGGCGRLISVKATVHQCENSEYSWPPREPARPEPAPTTAHQPPPDEGHPAAPRPARETVYLSGPMTGIPQYNAPAFAAAAERYRGFGFEVLSPPELDSDGPKDDTYENYLRRDLRLFLDGNVSRVYMLTGWESSKGATLEKHVAEMLKIPVFDAETGEPIPPGKQPTVTVETADRKEVPICSGVLDYFPAALAAVARLSKIGNDKHNPGEPLHWARGKSMDHADCLARHLVDRGIIDPDSGLSHTVQVAWRALALLQEEEEARGAPRPRGAY